MRDKTIKMSDMIENARKKRKSRSKIKTERDRIWKQKGEKNQQKQ